MRVFFIGLLIVNIAFAGWYWFSGPSAPEPVLKADPGVEMLKLVSEHAMQATDVSENGQTTGAGLTQQQSPPPTPVKTAARSTATHCFRAGLYPRPEETRKVAAQLEALGYAINISTRYPKRVKFLVYLPAYPSYAEASQVTAHLKSVGQHDYQILAIKGEKNSISLGVYSQEPTAQIRRNEIASLGYEPVVEAVYGLPLGQEIEFSKAGVDDLGARERAILVESDENISIKSGKCR